MLMIVSESLRRAQPLIEVARELSLNLCHFPNVPKLVSLMSGRSRRIVMLGEKDVSEDVFDALQKAAAGATRFGLIICADREALRSSDCARLLGELGNFDNVEWLGPEHDVDSLSNAARKCRRRMLTLGKNELEEAILKRQFFVQYQPKVERNAGTEWLTREAEALIRWHHPRHGLLGPLEFLPEAEAFDLIAPISELVLFEAAAQLVQWREQGLNLNSCINLASSQLNNRELPRSYERIVRKHNLECSSFTFEVTERDVANSAAPHIRVLNELRERGFRISLDDFGVATSSLSTFEQLPFDEIKIHANALARAQVNPVARKVLAAVTGLAHKLGISVCAEGVEDQETFEFLKTIECDKMQGFLISEAVMPDIIRRVYSARAKQVDDVA
jgi:EAL domain-containing protein (putative c-di-GMP-specific phosphodiesterase class I)